MMASVVFQEIVKHYFEFSNFCKRDVSDVDGLSMHACMEWAIAEN